MTQAALLHAGADRFFFLCSALAQSADENVTGFGLRETRSPPPLPAGAVDLCSPRGTGAVPWRSGR